MKKTGIKPDIVPRPVPMEFWSKDHWSTLGYLEVRAVDFKGVINRENMRVDPELHPGLAHRGSAHPCAPTRLNFKGEWNGIQLPDHDDFSCLEDMEAAGLLTWEGTGVHPMVKFTAKGHLIAGQLRSHRASGGFCADFKPGAT